MSCWVHWLFAVIPNRPPLQLTATLPPLDKPAPPLPTRYRAVNPQPGNGDRDRGCTQTDSGRRDAPLSRAATGGNPTTPKRQRSEYRPLRPNASVPSHFQYRDGRRESVLPAPGCSTREG